ncbi:MAG: DNA helicase RecQ, partial [Defluviitaleaceae bacterium]|nr:DNA helicase RecQ [Defluviitaleaceae bacterium]
MLTKFETLKQHFGYDSFRYGQDTIIDDILASRDVLGIMPTGAGKSICFQIPALMMDGVVIVISPLISLMKDQVNALNQSGIGAAYINSSLNDRQISKALHNAQNGVYRLVYVAPERLNSWEFLNFATYTKISMLVVDEAHCISQWGQDFRPSYTAIPHFVKQLPVRPVISAFTATATPRVREDIIEKLALNSPAVLISGFDRPNLHFDKAKPKEKTKALLKFLEKRKDGACGIVYCSTRNQVEDVHFELLEAGYSASRYHAGLADGERSKNQDDFLHDRARIMVATNAFGMGIDKSNVSFVVHYNMPKDLEAYYQEAGRAGRDGAPADCLLLYSGRDIETHKFLINKGDDSGRANLDPQTEALIRQQNLKRLNEMVMYSETRECLRSYILQYFGESPGVSCGNCGNCSAEFEDIDITTESQKVISCVARMRERFGVNLVIDVLRGAKSQKIRENGLDSLTTYGISQKTTEQLQDVVNFLILNEYLHKTSDRFSVLKLGKRASEALKKGKKITMKAPLNWATQATAAYAPTKAKAYYALSKNMRPVDGTLLAALRDLRTKFAKEAGLPAFTIFHDSTLTDMCMKMPSNIGEMLNVSGVGQAKADRYGQAFLEVINAHNVGADTIRPPAAPITYD